MNGRQPPKASQVTRLNRTQADEIAQTLDALSVMALNRPETIQNVSQEYATAFTSAADAIRVLAKQRALTPLENEAYLATRYSIDLNDETHEMRVVFYKGDQKNAHSFLTLSSPEAYDFANHILAGYDDLEGIK